MRYLALSLLILSTVYSAPEPKPDPDPREHGDSLDPTNVKIKTKNGEVIGFKEPLDALNRKRGRIEEANIFLGIPFAKPPVGELRFEVRIF